MTIAVDFDGTIVEHKYPAIGKEKPFAIETLKRLQFEGHRLAATDIAASTIAVINIVFFIVFYILLSIPYFPCSEKNHEI